MLAARQPELLEPTNANCSVRKSRSRPLVGSPSGQGHHWSAWADESGPQRPPVISVKRRTVRAKVTSVADGAGGRAGIASDLGNEPTTTSQAAGSMPPPCADAYVPGSTASRSSGPGSGIASTSPAYAKLQRLSTDVPATSSLPDEISLPEPGSLRALTVGRHAHKNDVMLDCKLVPSLLSRQHAEIHCDTEGVHYVMDKNTLNGTYLNGNLIPTGPVPLKDGDVIALAGHECSQRQHDA